MAAESSRSATHLKLQLARALSSCGEAAEGVSWYRGYLQVESGQAGVWYELGEALARAHQPREAAQAFRRMLEIAPRNAGGELGLAQA
ncbi:MAG TPA: tetratricopeptide repeat protein, partial [Terriglobia bacterium]|nr:tetratricopeptide repeat protein [Terriglobia bacterium]